MSAWQVLREAPRRLGEAASQRPQLRGLPRPTRRLSTAWFAVLMVGILVAGTVGQLFFITYLQSQAFDVRTAKEQAAELSYQVSDLEAKVFAAEAPAEVARRATELGMVPNKHAVFIDLSTDEIVGEPVAAQRSDMPGLQVTDPAPAASATATPSPQPSQSATATPKPTASTQEATTP